MCQVASKVTFPMPEMHWQPHNLSSQVLFANLWHLRKLSLLPIKQADNMLGLHNEIIDASVDWFFKKAHKNHLGMIIMQDYARTFKHQTIFMLITTISKFLNLIGHQQG